MVNAVQYISPSNFYYWEKCPLKAVFSNKYRGKQFFPKHPDADLGSIIHRFYEKSNEWKVNTPERFLNKWKQEINDLNYRYQRNKLQKRYYPVQWHARYYTVKKHLLLNMLLSKRTSSSSKSKMVFEKWMNDEIIGGYVDFMIVDADEIKQITDFKTGSIFEVFNREKKIKEVYKLQLALYASVVLNTQSIIPDLFIETIKRDKYIVEMSEAYINEVKYRAVNLKNKINTAIHENNIHLLANPNSENCKYCDYRMVCQSYNSTMMNKKMDRIIDINGEITNKNNKEVEIKAGKSIFKVRNVQSKISIEIRDKLSIYNLYYPNKDENILYFVNNSIIKDE